MTSSRFPSVFSEKNKHARPQKTNAEPNRESEWINRIEMPRMNHDMDDEMEDAEAFKPAGGNGKIGARLLWALLGRWYWILFGVILGLSGAAYYLSRAIPEYAASATLMVKQQTSGVLSVDQPGEIDMRSVEAMNTVGERLKRPKLLEKVAARADVRKLEGLMPKRAKWLPDWLGIWMGMNERDGLELAGRVPDKLVAAMLGNRMTVSVKRGTRLLDITVRHPSSEAAVVLADAVADEFIKESSQSKTTGRSNSLEILTAKSDEARGSLQNAQRALASYVRALASHEQLEEKEKEMTELRRRYLGKHPKMIACSAQIEMMQNRFLEHFGSAANSGADHSYWKETNLLKKGAEAALSDRLNEARQALLARTAVLKSEIQSQELVFNAILTKMGETDVNQGRGDSEVELSSQAVQPGIPVTPVPSKAWMLGLIAGGAIGLALAYGFIRIDNKFHTVFEVESETGVPALGAVPEVSLEKLHKSFNGSGGETLGHERAWTAGVLFRSCLASTNLAEMFRVLRTSVTLLGSEKTRKITMFTSAVPGEGKTFIAANFALAAAAQGRKVLLVDLDLRKPSVRGMFGMESDNGGPGVVEVLAGQGPLHDCVQREVAPNLDLLACLQRSHNPGELFVEETLDRLFQAACASYDVVVVDTAPLLAVPDARLIARHAHNICLVVRAEYVPRNAVRRVLSLLGSNGTPVAGVVVNGFSDKRTRHSSNYGYGSYGSYGSEKNGAAS